MALIGSGCQEYQAGRKGLWDMASVDPGRALPPQQMTTNARVTNTVNEATTHWSRFTESRGERWAAHQRELCVNAPSG